MADSESQSGLGKLRYKCIVRSVKNPDKVETITIEAKSYEEAVEKLQRDKYLIISVQAAGVEQKSGFFGLKFPSKKDPFSGPGNFFEESRLAKDPTTTGSLKGRIISIGVFSRVSSRELISFAVQLAALLQGGIPLLKSLQISQRGTQNQYFKSILESCIKNVSSGFSFSQSIKEHPKVFPPVWQHLIEVGETSGTLPAVLREIAHYQESAARLRSKVISAFFYPMVLITFAILAVSFLLFKIIPTFEEMFISIDVPLPLITQIVMAISRVLRQYFLVVVGLFIAFVIGIVLAKRTKEGTYFLDLMKLRMPIMGGLLLQVSVVRFGRSLATMLRSGVPILQALELSSKLTLNAVAEEQLDKAREAVKSGRSLSAQLEASEFFPPFMTQLVAVGEETGELDRFLELVCNYYEETIDTFLARLTTLIEPLLLIIVGAIIGVIVISMFLPIIELSTNVR